MVAWHPDFKVGEWKVTPKLSRVEKNGLSTTIKQKSMAVLVCLADARGEVVTRQAIMDTVWPRVEVTDDVLTQSIVELRKAFDDDARHPKIIETIPRLGFRLIAQVTPATGQSAGKAPGARPVGSALPPGVRPGSEDRHAKARRSAWNYLPAVLALVIIAFGVWWFGASKDRARKPVISVSEPHPIAVLPFTNLSGEAGNEYFSDGLSEELRILLARIPGLKVIGRTSSQAFKGKNEDLRVIGETLGVDTVVEGSVRRSGERVRVTTQLIDVSDGAQIWSETYERPMTDIFAVQDDIAALIIDALQIHVGENPNRGRPTESSEAYSLFLKARAAMHGQDWRPARELLLSAIEIDAEFAEAFELLAYYHWNLAGYDVSLAESQRLAGVAAGKALATDSDLAFARALFESTNVNDYSLLRVIEAFERTVREQPAHSAALDILGFYLLEAGYLQEALLLAERYVDRDPLSFLAYRRLVTSLLALGRTDEAIAALDVAEQIMNTKLYKWRAELYLANKRDDAAIALIESSLQEEGYVADEWVSDLIINARNPEKGQTYMDRRIPEIVASTREEDAYEWWSTLAVWYQLFGFLDRQLEVILEADPGPVWTGAEQLTWNCTVYRHLGFTAHPRYLEVARRLGFIEVWEQRGPPDYCEKTEGTWVCH